MKFDDFLLEAEEQQVESTALVKQDTTTFQVYDRGTRYIYLMDPITRKVERKLMGPDGHLGGFGGE